MNTATIIQNNLVLYGIVTKIFQVFFIIKPFKYKASTIGKTVNDSNTKEVEFSVLLKHDFLKTLNMPLINCNAKLYVDMIWKLCNIWKYNIRCL